MAIRLTLAGVLWWVGAARVTAAPLKIAYSDWPGWVAWEIALQKGWLKSAGVEVEFSWSEYGPSLEAFAAGKVDAVMTTNGDALVAGANGAKSVIVLVTDYSNGNDMIVARPGIASLRDLKGKKIGLETGLVEHLLLLNALKESRMQEADVTVINVPTAQTPEALATGRVDAIAAWQPSAGQALKALAGAHALYTSADEPGLIYDTLAVSPRSLAENRAAWIKVASVWDQIVTYIRNPATRADAVTIMARAGTAPEEYATNLDGTRLLTLAEGNKKMTAGATAGFGSLKLSCLVANDFNLKNGVYKTSQDPAAYIDAQVVEEAMLAAGK